MKKRIAMFLALGLCLGMTACGGQTEQTAEGDGLKEVTLVLDYVPNTNHTGIYVAQKSSYFEQHGLKVNIIEPGDNDAITLCAVGKAEFAVTYQENVTYARTASEPLPIRAIAAIIQHNTSGFISRAEDKFSRPRTLRVKPTPAGRLPARKPCSRLLWQARALTSPS